MSVACTSCTRQARTCWQNSFSTAWKAPESSRSRTPCVCPCPCPVADSPVPSSPPARGRACSVHMSTVLISSRGRWFSTQDSRCRASKVARSGKGSLFAATGRCRRGFLLCASPTSSPPPKEILLPRLGLRLPCRLLALLSRGVCGGVCCGLSVLPTSSPKDALLPRLGLRMPCRLPCRLPALLPRGVCCGSPSSPSPFS
mmetsp:Transcript_22118/g.49175  ORF Transcript_22118/g.49175 Transcript_22118/m.49175 type:complete len:200 (-) Transcript_22118:520-1119(-)